MHPDEIQLLDYAEGEAGPEIAAHVERCPACAEQVNLLRAGREALRSAPLLELSEAGRDAIRGRLGPQAEQGRSRRRTIAVLVPIAAALAAVVALATLNDGTGNQGGDAGGSAAGGGEAGQTAPATQESAAGADTVEDRATLRLVEGPADELAAFLRARGFEARVRDGRVVVTGADPADVAGALAGRRDGGVRVIVRNP